MSDTFCRTVVWLRRCKSVVLPLPQPIAIVLLAWGLTLSCPLGVRVCHSADQAEAAAASDTNDSATTDTDTDSAPAAVLEAESNSTTEAALPSDLDSGASSDDQSAKPEPSLEPETPVAIDYLQQIKPLLQAKCAMCHGAVRQEGGLRVDTGEFLAEGGYSGAAITPGDLDESTLIAAITGAEGFTRMPLDTRPLSDEEIALFKHWINSGAKYPEDDQPLTSPDEHWAYQPVQRPQVPAIATGPDSPNPIDAFIADKHHQLGLTPLSQVDKNLLLRRVYIDLVGFPPTPEEVQAFLDDQSPDAYEQVVDRLLASPHYGERWARHWMDVWRYSDWDGYRTEVRESQPHLWRWRDWIIESLNHDQGYNQMIVEMLAGDELAPADPDTLRATGYLARSWFKFNRNVWLESTVEHTGKAFLGLTFNCAKCHDHMYDPISQKNHFQFRAFFEPYDVRADTLTGDQGLLTRTYDLKLDEPTFLFARGNEAAPVKDDPLEIGLPEIFAAQLDAAPVKLPREVYYPGIRAEVREAARSAAQAKLTQAEQKLSEAEKHASQSPWVQLHLLGIKAEVTAAQAELAAIEARILADEANYTLSGTPSENAEELSLAAGASERLGKLKQAQAELLLAEGEAAQARLTLADLQQTADASADPKVAEEAQKKLKAATDKLSTTQKQVEDAAALALQPHAEYTRFSAVYPATSTGRRLALARWIANAENPLTPRVAVNHLWLRHFGQPLVSTVFDFGMNGQPPTHPELLDWLSAELVASDWKMKPLHRLMVTSQTYRMQSGSAEPQLANLKLDPDNLYYWRMNPRRLEAEAVRDSVLKVAGGLDLQMFGPELDHEQGLTLGRRSIYFRASKEKKMVFLSLFDAANVAECYRRNESIVPQQALAMANSPLSLTQSRKLAQQLTQQFGETDTAETQQQYIAQAFAQILCRTATPAEVEICLGFLQQQTELFADKTELTRFETGEALAVPPAEAPHLRARENLIHVLLNHNDFLTVR